MDLKHEESEIKNRFYLKDANNEVGEMTYVYKQDHIIDLNHTEIDSAYRGQNLGQKLIEAAIDFCINKNLKATATCPYAKKMLERSERYNQVKV